MVHLDPAFEFDQLTVLDKSRNARNQGRPQGNAGDGEDQFGQDAAMKTEEDGPFGVFVEVSRAMLHRLLVLSRQFEGGAKHTK